MAPDRNRKGWFDRESRQTGAKLRLLSIDNRPMPKNFLSVAPDKAFGRGPSKKTSGLVMLSGGGPERALEEASHVLVVHDSTLTGDYIHHRVLHLLHRYPHLTSSLVINK
ncbi:unnamed protein product, partial [Anisakis simplex]|uniref:Uncharacterized GTP-binding protein (inferred by orthology to a C. elegans protein) n=1 Tax=Anisakis simplex TaxID=6269 RepID=A0A0M3JEV2_ANISI